MCVYVYIILSTCVYTCILYSVRVCIRVYYTQYMCVYVYIRVAKIYLANCYRDTLDLSLTKFSLPMITRHAVPTRVLSREYCVPYTVLTRVLSREYCIP